LFRGQHAGPATDLWALGVTMYWALEDRSPFRGETMEATIAAILSKNPPEPRSQGDLAALVLQMLDKRPSARPDPSDMRAVLQSVAGGRSAARMLRPRPLYAPDTGNGTAPMPGPRSPGRASQRQDMSHLSQRQAQRLGEAQPVNPRRRLTPLSGLPALTAAEMIAKWPSDRAVADLLAMEEGEAANIINRCGDTDAGRLLSAIATEQPALARKFLDMVTAHRRGRLLNHMSSPAAASVLVLPPLTGAVRRGQGT
jgi:hypothetical protein